MPHVTELHRYLVSEHIASLMAEARDERLARAAAPARQDGDRLASRLVARLRGVLAAVHPAPVARPARGLTRGTAD